MRPLTIVHDEPRLLVCLKPPGLLTVAPPKGAATRGQPTLLERLRSDGLGVLYAVHRLDQETSGLVMVARDKDARDLLMDCFKRREVEKRYLAIVQGHPARAEGSIREPIEDRGAVAVVSARGQPAETRYRVLEKVGAAAIVEAIPLTGRHNQIRIHFAHVGHPLVGERKYARGRDAAVTHKRAALHAAGLRFVSPFTDAQLDLEAAWPLDLENLLAKLRG